MSTEPDLAPLEARSLNSAERLAAVGVAAGLVGAAGSEKRIGANRRGKLISKRKG